MLEFEHIDAIDLPGLSEDRRPVMPGGLLVLQACFNELGLKRMQVCQTAMREGVLHDMIGRAQHRDPRDASIAALAKRYGVDVEHAARIEQTALAMFDQVGDDWSLDEDDRLMLAWAVRIHEIGLAIAHSQHHVHGAYLIEHSDIAGFSRQEQQVLSVLLRCQRRNIPRSALDALPERLAVPALRLIALLRLATLLHRSHDRAALPPLTLRATSDLLDLRMPATWLEQHPLSRSDLDTERDYLAALGLRLTLNGR
jgi:exopolyphosphatase/guanosine-5'-triphosphate,3'-diphosphate pyrophosphatase